MPRYKVAISPDPFCVVTMELRQCKFVRLSSTLVLGAETEEKKIKGNLQHFLSGFQPSPHKSPKMNQRGHRVICYSHNNWESLLHVLLKLSLCLQGPNSSF